METKINKGASALHFTQLKKGDRAGTVHLQFPDVAPYALIGKSLNLNSNSF